MKIKIEMEVPEAMDPSDILARMQELAVEIAEEFEDDEMMEDLPDYHDYLQDQVSVEVVREVTVKAS